MLRKALQRFGAEPSRTPLSETDDVKAALRARCRPLLVRTGLGAETLATGLPPYLRIEVYEDLAAAVDVELERIGCGRPQIIRAGRMVAQQRAGPRKVFAIVQLPCAPVA